MDATEAKRRMLATLPRGWQLAQVSERRTPFEQFDHPAAVNGPDHRGERLVLKGPTSIRVDGYYCNGVYCSLPAKEALELWIMPASYRSDQDAPDIQGWRSAELVAAIGKIQVFALVTRDFGDVEEFDHSFNGSSRETSHLRAARDKDLPLSWSSWHRDLLAALGGKLPPTPRT